MLKYVLVKGLQYEGESTEDMARREAAMEENNRRVDELYADWERQRRTPMRSMIDWAAKRGMLAVFVIALLSGCSHLTVTPKPVVSHTASFSGNKQTSGVISADQYGVIVDSGWMARYDSLLAKYGKDLTPPVKSGDRVGVTKVGNDYRVSMEVSIRFAEMNQRLRNGE